MNKQSGQTLIETLVACFILVMGISAALGLANYSLGATTNIKQQTIALGLAREGIEVVKNIRDTNWFKDTLTSSCYDFLSSTPSDPQYTAYCYQNWLNPLSGLGQDISASSGPRNFALHFDENLDNPWVLFPTESDFGLNNADFKGMSPGFDGVYYVASDGLRVSESDSGFGRAITISEVSDFTPFDQNTGPRLKVSSQVWWSGKNCQVSDVPPSDQRCAVVIETYLTNWRNF